MKKIRPKFQENNTSRLTTGRSGFGSMKKKLNRNNIFINLM
ncbi:MAG: hypothetical protein PUC50_05845 [Bacteroidales bacterium]|nr:hypothetical protein [Bacteroidales bacterium]